MEDAVDDGSDFWEVISQDEAYLDYVIKIDACEAIFERANFFVGYTPEYELVLAHL